MAIIVVGIGPGDPNRLTVQARDLLAAAPEVWFRTLRHPTVAELVLTGVVHSFDDVYETSAQFEGVYATIIDRLTRLAADGRDVLYAVPGHPLVAEATVRRLLELAQAGGPAVRIVDGLSFIEPVCAAIGLDPFAGGLQLVDALAPQVDPARPALIAQVYSRAIASRLKLALLELYPPEHTVTVIRAAGTGDQSTETVTLAELDRQDGRFDHLACLYVPALVVETNLRTFEGLRAITHRLRAPGGCPWDRKQSHASLKPFLLEEAYEVLAALDDGDPARLAEELGDLLLQMTLHTEIAEEAGEFTYGDVFAHISAKLLRRHPHVFGSARITTAEEQWRAWQQIKREEKGGAESILAGVPRAMPALAFAQAVQERAARVGFDWPRVDDVLDKLVEEIAELRAAATPDERRDEFGDLLLVLANVARWLDLNAEEALRLAGQKFVRRFGGVEALAHARGQDLAALDLAGLDALWNEVKAAERDQT